MTSLTTELNVFSGIMVLLLDMVDADANGLLKNKVGKLVVEKLGTSSIGSHLL